MRERAQELKAAARRGSRAGKARQGRLLLPKRAEIQNEVRDVRL
jgi:hypothetical protein